MLLLGLALGVPVLARSAPQPEGGPTAAGLPPLPNPDAITAALSEGLVKYEKEVRLQEEELESPASIAERESSRQAYADLGPAQAEALLEAEFGEQLEELNADPARALSDEHLDHAAGEDAATVTGEGKTRLLETTIPVEAENAAGEEAKVDLTLEETSAGFEPENPLVDLSIGKSVEEGVEVGEDGLTITQAGTEGAVGRPMGDKNVLYNEVAPGTDTDLMASPVSGGVELSDFLRSAESPEELRFELTLPEGATLRTGEAGGAEVVDADGRTDVIPAPWAKDAQGTEVPVSMTVEGDSLVLEVPHQEQEFAYPIMVDPTIYQDWGWWYEGQHLSGLWAFRSQSIAGWAGMGHEENSYFPEYQGRGLFISSPPANFGPGEWAQWIYNSPNGGTYISDATINPLIRRDGACWQSTWPVPHDYEGIWDEPNGHWPPGGYYKLYYDLGKNQGYADMGGGGEALIIGMTTGEGGLNTCSRALMIGGVGVWLDDFQAPTVSIGGLPAGWVGKDGTARAINVSAADAGLGVQSVAMTTPASIGWNQPWCAGTYENRCPESRGGTIAYSTSAFPEGADSVNVRVTDPTAKEGSASGTIRVDGTAPTASIVATQTSTTVNAKVESSDGSAAAPRSGVKEVKVYLDGTASPIKTETNSCSTSGCPYTLNFTYSLPLKGLAAGKHTLEAIAFDQLGHQHAATTSFLLEAPDTMITSGPGDLTKEATPKFTYTSTVAGSTFQCRVDTGAWVSCAATGYTTAKLSEGPHTFEVKATSGAGLEDPTPAIRKFTYVGPPDTTITFGPEGPTFATRPVFGYQSDNSQAWFECKVDSGAFEPCGPASYEALEGQFGVGLSDGAHSVSVRAVNQVEVPDPTPAVASFTVDTDSPSAEVTAGPEGSTNVSSPTFTFAASGGTVACFLEADGEPETESEPAFDPCTTATSYTPPAPLSAGRYTLRLLAVDGAMNETEDARQFTVDTTAPETTITSAPAATTDQARPTLAFVSSEPESSFQCHFDAEAFRPCSGPGAVDTPATALKDGPHTFAVRAIDAAGNVDPTPAAASFAVLTTGPQAALLTGPEGAIGATNATFTYSADKAATFECRLDGAAFASCPSTGDALTALAEGEHVFEVRARNATAPDPTPARGTFVVDTSAPSTPILAGPIFEAGGYGLRFTVEVTDGSPATSAAKRSGVQSVQILIGGKLAMELGAECAMKICPAAFTREPQIPWRALLAAPEGAVVEAVAKDGLGHISTATKAIAEPHSHALEPSQAPEEGGQQRLAQAAPAGSPVPGCGEAPTKLPSGRYNKKRGVAEGTPRADLILAPAGITRIEGGNGCDVLIAGPDTNKIEGGAGDDIIRGGPGNDELLGGGNNDWIYGENGDDTLKGEGGNDVLDGGLGGDEERGEAGDDTLRGGQGGDKLIGGPGAGTDTASFADVLAPGFAEAEKEEEKGGRPNLFKRAKDKARQHEIGTFPPPAEAGVYIDLPDHMAYGGDPAEGGGTDSFKEIDRVVGSPFADWIDGDGGATQIDPGPGADMVYDAGAGLVCESVDWVEGKSGNSSCTHPVSPSTGSYQAGLETDVYTIGSGGGDNITANLKSGNVTGAGGATTKVGGQLGALVLYGGGGNDTIRVTNGNRKAPGTIELDGGPDADKLYGGPLGELIFDGIGQTKGTETLSGGPGEDVLAQGEGPDKVEGGPDDDLFLNSRVCEGDSFYADASGSAGSKTALDNVQFHLLPNLGVSANLGITGSVGGIGTNGKATYSEDCGGGRRPPLRGFNAFEGSERDDSVKGNANHNYILGRGGENRLYGLGGNDAILANNGHPERVIDCGGDQDTATVDPADREFNPPGTKLENTCEGVKSAAPKYDDGQEYGQCDHSRKLTRLKGKKALKPVDCWPKEASSSTAASSPQANLAGTASASPSATSAALELPEASESSAWPIAGYHLDETTGTVATNAVDEEASATYMAKGIGPSVNGPGPVLGGEGALLGEGAEGGSSISLDGTDAYVDLHGQAAPVAGQESWSLLLYVRFAQAPGKREYLFSAGAGGRGTYLYRAADGSLVFSTGQVFGAPTVVSEPVTDTSWHQVVASFVGQQVTLDIDGFPYVLGYGSEVARPPGGSPQSLLGAGPGVTDLLSGDLDEVTAYEGAFGELEVFSLLAASKATLAPNLPAATPEADGDGDGIPDGLDNCPTTSNPDQADANLDGIGDACQAADQDEDGVTDASDNCPTVYNPEQTDTNGDGLGDDCSNLSPEVETGEAKEVTATTATITGTVEPEGLATSYYFEYGPTTAYGARIPASPKAAGTGFTSVAVSQALTGLSQATTYHYRLVAESSAGSQTGEDETFTTLKLPKATISAATAVNNTSANLKGTVNPEGLATTYQFEYGTSLAYGTKAPATAPSAGSGTSAVAVSTPLSGLVAGTTYHYRIAATSAGGTAYSGSSTFTTAGGAIGGVQLAAMPVTEPFDGSSTSLSNFASKWAALGWAAGTTPKGSDTTAGWGPYDAFSTVDGAYYNSSLSDTGSGLAAVATLGTSPGITERYFSLWLDLSNPTATTRSGYELRFTDIGTNLYKVTLSRWAAGVQTVLATEASYSLPVGGSLALTDQGSTVSAWTNTGSGFVKLIGATNSELSGGRAGVEGSGNISRLKNFKFGVPSGSGGGG